MTFSRIKVYTPDATIIAAPKSVRISGLSERTMTERIIAKTNLEYRKGEITDISPVLAAITIE